MQFRKRTLSAVVAAVVSASLAAGPALMEPASAASTRATVTDECASAQAAHAVAVSTKTTAHRALVKARKALRKAKHTHRAAKIRKAKRNLKHAKTRYAARTRDEHVQAARVGYACSSPTSSSRAAGTGMKLDILAIATGSGSKVLDGAGLAALLEDLLPGSSSALDAGQLSALLSGFNTGTPSLDDATVLLGSVFTPDQLTALLGGSPDPTLVLTLLQNIIEQLSGLSGVPVPPGALDPTALQGVVTTVTTLLGGLATSTTGGSGGGGTLICLPLVGCL